MIDIVDELAEDSNNCISDPFSCTARVRVLVSAKAEIERLRAGIMEQVMAEDIDVPLLRKLVATEQMDEEAFGALIDAYERLRDIVVRQMAGFKEIKE